MVWLEGEELKPDDTELEPNADSSHKYFQLTHSARVLKRHSFRGIMQATYVSLSDFSNSREKNTDLSTTQEMHNL